MLVAIHQPNYLPWLGYFAKFARADIFIFLDNAQYTKNSYINRVQIDAGGGARWMTVPVSYSFGDTISAVHPANSGWRQSHLDMLRTHYGDAPAFANVWRWLSGIFADLPDDDIATINAGLISAIADRLGLQAECRLASSMKVADARGDDRLIALLHQLGENVTYLSGEGGAKYQEPVKFEAAGIGLEYAGFEHPEYAQGHDFVSGLSIVDALFRTGFERTAEMIGKVRVES